VAKSVTFWSAGPAGSTIPELLYGSDSEIPRSVFGPVSENPTLVSRGGALERAGSGDETVLPRYSGLQSSCNM
jgi:hypothetical protein